MTTRKTTFKPGQSGNPKGRPPGIKDRRMALREKIAEHADELIELAIKAARKGDMTALSLLLSRAVAPLRAQAPSVQFDMPVDGDLAATGRAVVAACAAGTLAPDTARQLLDGLASLAALIDLDEVQRRLDALEQRSPTP